MGASASLLLQAQRAGVLTGWAWAHALNVLGGVAYAFSPHEAAMLPVREPAR